MNTLSKQDAATPPLDESTRLIPLTQGQFAIVDAADFDWLNQWKWFAINSHRSGRYYAARTDDSRKQIPMHRQILGLEPGDISVGDHRNGDTLDNTRINLRRATYLQNARNAKKRKNIAGFKGVRLHKKSGKWYARIRIEKELIHIGCFNLPELAARAYDAVAREHFGEFAWLNFPENKS